MNLRKGDMVQVIAGDTRDHGKRGKILSVDWKADRVLVEGVNLIKRHTKPSSNNQQGGIIEKEAPVHVSNVMPWCDSAGRPSKIIMKTLDDGSRVRAYKINGETLKDK
ncbi:MAG: 50S ribosomal protein L24 [Candidatus Hydrogenedentes bacterium]|nr:50S ribosomal protein L24 [Candidatus Hydrogenedentota bacterium]